MSEGGGVERLPRASLRGYAALSGAALAAAGYHAVRLAQPAHGAPSTLAEQLVAAAPHMLREPLCLWAVVNCVWCVCASGGAAAARVALGEGATGGAAGAAARDAVATFAVHKLMLVVGAAGVLHADQLLLAAAWFAVLAALTALHTLANSTLAAQLGPGDGGDGSVPRGAEWLGGGVAACSALLLAATWPLAPLHVCEYAHTIMAAECGVVWLWGLHACTRRRLATWDTHCICFDAVALGLEAVHVTHVLCRSGLALSLPALVLLLRLRRLLHELGAALRTATVRRATLHHVTQHYPMASAEEVKQNQDKCAICWEPMQQARRLPCHHLFHNACLCRWVSQDASCPTCRRTLTPPPHPAAATRARPPPPHYVNRLFHFDGGRYVSWLPSVSLEVTRAHVTAGALDAMALQVQQLFPQMGVGALLADLAVTRSAHLTIDNILAGRLNAAAADSPIHTAMPAPPPDVTSSHAAARTPPTPPHVAVATSDDDHTDTLALTPVEFSPESREREALLARRKRALLAAARRRYLQRHPHPQT